VFVGGGWVFKFWGFGGGGVGGGGVGGWGGGFLKLEKLSPLNEE